MIQGHGFSFFIKSAVVDEIREGKLIAIPVREGNPHLNIDIVFRKKSHFSHAARAFMNIIEAEKKDGAFRKTA